MKLFFGGSFDPVHMGHLIIARDVVEVLGFNKVVFVPAFQAPLKDPHVASPEERMHMLNLALEGCEGFEVSNIELQRGGISYTVDTAKYIYKKYGERPFFLVGADSFLTLHLWKSPAELVSLARFVVVDREGYLDRIRTYVKQSFPQLTENRDFILFSARRIDISSTEIRKRVKEGRSIKWMVPESVEAYIKETGLYTTRPSPKV
ncbi:MAG: nicotinate (nicotinamide) nucleotide adenylyltransferase [Aquificaceae bacterium]|nr:nicotinate (nicotinamide) nucleotide adenylyltransferase [Aquificaceae bacterium]MDW8423209.1 nicotinate (nicotinamide) nucleotide adenylyltransferase [Aquificaceae bacterium]